MAKLDDAYQLLQLASSIASLQSGKYSDLTIRCSDNTVIRAHRAVVCPRSRVLSAMFDGKFEEAMSNEVYLDADEPDIVKNMVRFMYTTGYDDRRSAGKGNLDLKAENPVAVMPDLPKEDNFVNTSQNQPTEVSASDSSEYNPHSLVTNAQMYIIADKYEIEALKTLASVKYEEVVRMCWNTFEFSESARLIHENTIESDRTIKDVIEQVASDNINTLLDRGEFTALLNGNGELATRILKRVAASKKSANVSEDGPSSWGASSYKGKRINGRIW